MSGTTGETVRHVAPDGSFRELSEYAINSVEISCHEGPIRFVVKRYSIDLDEARTKAITQFAALQAEYYPPPPSLAGQLEASLQKVAATSSDGALPPKGKIRL